MLKWCIVNSSESNKFDVSYFITSAPFQYFYFYFFHIRMFNLQFQMFNLVNLHLICNIENLSSLVLFILNLYFIVDELLFC